MTAKQTNDDSTYFALREHKLSDAWKERLESYRIRTTKSLLVTDVDSKEEPEEGEVVWRGNFSLYTLYLAVKDLSVDRLRIAINQRSLMFYDKGASRLVTELGGSTESGHFKRFLEHNLELYLKPHAILFQTLKSIKKILIKQGSQWCSLSTWASLQTREGNTSWEHLTNPEVAIPNWAIYPRIDYAERSINYDLNPQGCRSHHDFSAIPSRNVIATVGCSNTYGQSVEYADTWAQRLERHPKFSALHRSNSVLVYNYATPAASLDECYMQLVRIYRNAQLKRRLTALVVCLPSIHRCSLISSHEGKAPAYYHALPNWKVGCDLEDTYQSLWGASDPENAFHRGYMWLLAIQAMLVDMRERFHVKTTVFTWSTLTHSMLATLPELQNIRPDLQCWHWSGSKAIDGLHPSAAAHNNIANEVFVDLLLKNAYQPC